MSSQIQTVDWDSEGDWAEKSSKGKKTNKRELEEEEEEEDVWRRELEEEEGVWRRERDEEEEEEEGELSDLSDNEDAQIVTISLSADAAQALSELEPDTQRQVLSKMAQKASSASKASSSSSSGASLHRQSADSELDKKIWGSEEEEEDEEEEEEEEEEDDQDWLPEDTVIDHMPASPATRDEYHLEDLCELTLFNELFDKMAESEDFTLGWNRLGKEIMARVLVLPASSSAKDKKTKKPFWPKLNINFLHQIMPLKFDGDAQRDMFTKFLQDVWAKMHFFFQKHPDMCDFQMLPSLVKYIFSGENNNSYWYGGFIRMLAIVAVSYRRGFFVVSSARATKIHDTWGDLYLAMEHFINPYAIKTLAAKKHAADMDDLFGILNADDNQHFLLECWVHSKFGAKTNEPKRGNIKKKRKADEEIEVDFDSAYLKHILAAYRLQVTLFIGVFYRGSSGWSESGPKDMSKWLHAVHLLASIYFPFPNKQGLKVDLSFDFLKFCWQRMYKWLPPTLQKQYVDSHAVMKKARLVSKCTKVPATLDASMIPGDQEASEVDTSKVVRSPPRYMPMPNSMRAEPPEPPISMKLVPAATKSAAVPAPKKTRVEAFRPAAVAHSSSSSTFPKRASPAPSHSRHRPREVQEDLFSDREDESPEEEEERQAQPAAVAAIRRLMAPAPTVATAAAAPRRPLLKAKPVCESNDCKDKKCGSHFGKLGKKYFCILASTMIEDWYDGEIQLEDIEMARAFFNQ